MTIRGFHQQNLVTFHVFFFQKSMGKASGDTWNWSRSVRKKTISVVKDFFSNSVVSSNLDNWKFSSNSVVEIGLQPGYGGKKNTIEIGGPSPKQWFIHENLWIQLTHIGNDIYDRSVGKHKLLQDWVLDGCGWDIQFNRAVFKTPSWWLWNHGGL